MSQDPFKEAFDRTVADVHFVRWRRPVISRGLEKKVPKLVVTTMLFGSRKSSISEEPAQEEFDALCASAVHFQCAVVIK